MSVLNFIIFSTVLFNVCCRGGDFNCDAKEPSHNYILHDCRFGRCTEILLVSRWNL